MKQCKCGASIKDEYDLCWKCMNEEKANKGDALVEMVEKCNWNFGTGVKIQKFRLLSELEGNKNKTDIQKKIHQLLLKDLEKDLKAVENIKRDMGK